MSEFIPNNIRRRHSTDTLSTLDMPAPPYGLVDATQRAGSILNVPGPSGHGRPASPIRSGYKLRVGKLEIRCADQWEPFPKDYQLLEVGSLEHALSSELTAIIANFEDAIKRGHTLLILLQPYYNSTRSADIDLLYRGLLAFWQLCITVGAAMCEYEGTLPQPWIRWLATWMFWIGDSLLKDVIDKAQRLDLPDRTDAASKRLPAPTAAQTKLVKKFAGEMIKVYSEDIERATHALTRLNLLFHLKQFED